MWLVQLNKKKRREKKITKKHQRQYASCIVVGVVAVRLAAVLPPRPLRTLRLCAPRLPLPHLRAPRFLLVVVIGG